MATSTSDEKCGSVLPQVGHHLSDFGIAHRLIPAAFVLPGDDAGRRAAPHSEMGPAERWRIVAYAERGAEDVAQRFDLNAHSVGLVEIRQSQFLDARLRAAAARDNADRLARHESAEV